MAGLGQDGNGRGMAAKGRQGPPRGRVAGRVVDSGIGDMVPKRPAIRGVSAMSTHAQPMPLRTDAWRPPSAPNWCVKPLDNPGPKP